MAIISVNPGIDSRRSFLSQSGKLALSASAIALLAGKESLAASKSGGSADVAILNVALGLENQAINAYQIGAESGLLQKPVLDVAVLFQSHHKAHRDALIATIKKLDGVPVAEKTMAEYLKELNASSIKSQTDILNLAAALELGAANVYLSVIPSFGDNELSKIAGRLAADETMHWTTLNGALGRALPVTALSFGA